MQEKIRLATPEEIKEIEAESNITPMCRVLKLGEMTAVWRMAHELDPLIPGHASLQRQFKFIWGIENILKGAGVTEYFFQVPAADTHYHQAIEEHFGAERLSKQPDYRYRINL
jgi:hypothetical protein